MYLGNAIAQEQDSSPVIPSLPKEPDIETSSTQYHHIKHSCFIACTLNFLGTYVYLLICVINNIIYYYLVHYSHYCS